MMRRIAICLLVVFHTYFLMAQNYQKACDLFEKGSFSELKNFSDFLRTKNPNDAKVNQELDSLLDIASRIQLDFSLSESDIESALKTKIGSFTNEDKMVWEQNGWLEYRLINGQKKYFNRAVSNLKLRLNQQCDSASGKQPSVDELSNLCLQHTRKAITESKGVGQLAESLHYTLTYTLSVKPDVVPAGEMLRCWLPYPKENRLRQANIHLIETSQPDYLISPDSVGHRSLYMEKKTEAGKPTVFKIRFSFDGAAQYFDLKKATIFPYNKNSELYRKYTSEQAPHIVFSDRIKALADEIVGDEKRPEEIVKKLYDWIDDHIIWSGALEYSTMPNIPEYVLTNNKGDCGMQTLLFMTLARYKGIPVKWQSGWMLHPNEVNLHDWSEVYYEGVGWVPLDMSFGRQNTSDPALRYYYMSGIDAYRFIVNDEISAPFSPEKKFLRSETVDFQRGEVEWRLGNLYFDKWNYHLDVDYKADNY